MPAKYRLDLDQNVFVFDGVLLGDGLVENDKAHRRIGDGG